jgi:hypothetical protein
MGTAGNTRPAVLLFLPVSQDLESVKKNKYKILEKRTTILKKMMYNSKCGCV